MDSERDFVPGGEDAERAEQLEKTGCVGYGYVTALGRDVAKELRRKGILAGSED